MLFNFDFAMSYPSRVLYPFGISTDSNQMIIGKDDWLYLGDHYEQTITASRLGPTVEDAETARKIGLATKLWDQWLTHKGVRGYRIMLVPNKETVYPEYLPDWAKPARHSVTDLLLTSVSQGLYVDTRPTIRAARTQFLEPLYFKTDTHWNSLGAWLAFHAFAIELAHSETDLRWPTDQQIHISKIMNREGGDLANFLRMSEVLQDSYVDIEIASEHPIETEQYDFDTRHLIASGGNPQISSHTQLPLLVKSEHALNQKKVLWLRDSFGDAMAPLMAYTFTETLQMDYLKTAPALFASMVETFKPDYVFITVVERKAFSEWFANPPPIIFAFGKPINFISISHGLQSVLNDMTKVEGKDAYQISGADPYITFSLINPIRSQEVPELVFELNCGEKNDPLQIQVFWHTAGSVFSESSSVHFMTNPGIITKDMSQYSSWTQAGSLTDVRVDIDSPNACPVLTINNLELGK